jgi:hypothetical protein
MSEPGSASFGGHSLRSPGPQFVAHGSPDFASLNHTSTALCFKLQYRILDCAMMPVKCLSICLNSSWGGRIDYDFTVKGEAYR